MSKTILRSHEWFQRKGLDGFIYRVTEDRDIVKNRPGTLPRNRRDVPVYLGTSAGGSTNMLCRVLRVSWSGFYAWHRRRPSDRDDADRRLAVEIAAAHTESRRTYGSPRIHEELQAQGRRVSRKRVAWISVPNKRVQ